MRTRRWLGSLLASILIGCSGESGPPERIVLVVVDTLRRDHLSVYGGPVQTRNLDALAGRGRAFRNAYASFHQTSMSMGALFTGRTPSLESGALEPSLPWTGSTWCGLARFREATDPPARCIPAALPTLAERLRELGYWTIGVASNQFLFEPSGYSRGFDDWVEVGPKPESAGPWGRFVLDGAVRERTWIHVNQAARAALERRPRDRLFLYVHYMDVHDYAVGSEPAKLRGAYARAVAAVDVAVGRLLEALEQQGLRGSTSVIVTSDHGERLGERHALRGTSGHMGNPSFQELLAIPLIVSPAPAGPSRPLLRSQDLHALILGIARGGAAEIPGSAELLIGEKRYRTYLDGRFKTVIRRSDGATALFDLQEDPQELRNVAKSHPTVLRRHLERIESESRALASGPARSSELSEGDRQRLRALGYLQE